MFPLLSAKCGICSNQPELTVVIKDFHATSNVFSRLIVRQPLANVILLHDYHKLRAIIDKTTGIEVTFW
jgi:hypothetical protein